MTNRWTSQDIWRVWLFNLSCVVSLALVTSEVRAQTNTGEIQGVVRDVQGGVLPGAIVIAMHVSSGLRVERVTDGAGRFFLPALPGGLYDLSVALQGFKPTTHVGIVVSAGQTIDLPVTLQIGQLSDAVTVTGVTPFLRAGNAELSDVIDNRQVAQLPLNGRQFLQLARLSDADPEINTMDQFTLRVDRRLGADDSLFGRFIVYRVRDTQPFGTSQLNETLVPGFGRIVTTSTRSFAVSHTRHPEWSAVRKV